MECNKINWHENFECQRFSFSTWFQTLGEFGLWISHDSENSPTITLAHFTYGKGHIKPTLANHKFNGKDDGSHVLQTGRGQHVHSHSGQRGGKGCNGTSLPLNSTSIPLALTHYSINLQLTQLNTPLQKGVGEEGQHLGQGATQSPHRELPYNTLRIARWRPSEGRKGCTTHSKNTH